MSPATTATTSVATWRHPGSDPGERPAAGRVLAGPDDRPAALARRPDDDHGPARAAATDARSSSTVDPCSERAELVGAEAPRGAAGEHDDGDVRSSGREGPALIRHQCGGQARAHRPRDARTAPAASRQRAGRRASRAPATRPEVHLAHHLGVAAGGIEQRAGAQQHVRCPTPGRPPRSDLGREAEPVEQSDAPGPPAARPRHLGGAVAGGQTLRPRPVRWPAQSAPGSPSRSASRSRESRRERDVLLRRRPTDAGPEGLRARPASRRTPLRGGPDRRPVCGAPRTPARRRTSTRRWWRVVLGCPPTAATRSATVGGCAAGAGDRPAAAGGVRDRSLPAADRPTAGVGNGPSGGIFFTTSL